MRPTIGPTGSRGLAIPDGCFPNRVDEAVRESDRDRDFPEVYGFAGSKGGDNPLNVESDTFKLHIFYLYGLGKNKRPRRYGRSKVLTDHRSKREQTWRVRTNGKRLRGIRETRYQIRYRLGRFNWARSRDLGEMETI